MEWPPRSGFGCKFARAVHETLDLRETCYTIVNEGRRLLGCDRVTVAIPSGDILLAIEEPRNTSARNVLRGRVILVEDKGSRVLVSVESGVTWRASVTRQATSDLRLAPGREVWLAFKTYSCHVVDR